MLIFRGQLWMYKEAKNSQAVIESYIDNSMFQKGSRLSGFSRSRAAAVGAAMNPYHDRQLFHIQIWRPYIDGKTVLAALDIHSLILRVSAGYHLSGSLAAW